MNNLVLQDIIDDLDDDLDIIRHNRDIIAHIVGILVVPVMAVSPERIPVRNENYVGDTISLYHPDEFKSHFRMTRAIFCLSSSVGS